MANWHALVIGVDRYASFPGKSLNGCVNDANAMARFLSEKVQIPSANLRLLLSPREETDPNTRATAANIRSAFSAVTAAAGKSDHVVLFFAGHGTQLSRAAAGGAKDRYYGFLPEDVAKSANGLANVVLGREIYRFLRETEKAGATITVIADTCHSGGATRGVEDDVQTRSLELPALSDVEWQQFTAAHPALDNRDNAVTDATPFGAYPGGDFVMLTGCLDIELAKEWKADVVDTEGKPAVIRHGLLTFSLLEELGREPAETIRSLRWVDLSDRLRNVVGQRAVGLKQGPQTPLIEGCPEKTVFGGEWKPFDPGFTVRKPDAGMLVVDGGALHGLDAGARITIFPPGTTRFEEAANGIDALIVSATPSTSIADAGLNAERVADGSRARLTQPSAVVTPILVRLRHDDPPMAEATRAAIAGDEFRIIEVEAAESTVAHAELRRWQGSVPESVWPAPREWAGARDGWVLVRPSFEKLTADEIVAYFPSSGGLAAGVPPEHAERAIGEAIARSLACWSRYLRARDRRAVDDTLKPMLDVRLRLAKTSERPESMDALPVVESKGGIYAVTDADFLWADIRVKTATKLRLQLGWLALSDDGNIMALWPPQGADNTYAVGDAIYAGRDREQALPLGVRPDQTISMWTLRLLACTVAPGAAPLNIRALEQDTAQAAFAAAIGSTRAATRGSLREAPPEQPAWYAWDFRVAVSAPRDVAKGNGNG